MTDVMERYRAYAHRHRPVNAPATEGRMRRLLQTAGIGDAGRVLDLGCGTGAWLLLGAPLATEGAELVGVDSDGAALKEAAWRLAATTAGEFDVTWTDADAAAWLDGTTADWDLVLCVGASHAFGGYGDLLEALTRCVRPGGHALVGEGFWAQTPDPEYLAFLGDDEDSLGSHADNVAQAADAGWVPVHAETATLDEWDTFTWTFTRVVEDACDRHTGELPPELADLRLKRRTWRDAYVRWGRETMGFGYYVLRRPTT